MCLISLRSLNIYVKKRNNVEYIKEIDILGQSKYYLLISEINEPLMELDFITLEGSFSFIIFFNSK